MTDTTNRYGYTVRTTISHTFFTYAPLTPEELRDIADLVAECPTDSDCVLEGLADLDTYDSASGVNTSYGNPEINALYSADMGADESGVFDAVED